MHSHKRLGLITHKPDNPVCKHSRDAHFYHKCPCLVTLWRPPHAGQVTTILVMLHAIELILLNWINSVDNLSHRESRGMTIHQINLDYRWPTQLKSLCHYCAAHLCKCPAGGYSLSLAYQKQHCSFMFTVNHATMWKTDFTDPQDLFPPTPTRTERNKNKKKSQKETWCNATDTVMTSRNSNMHRVTRINTLM